MVYVWMFLVFIGSFVIGVWGFCQIVGSIQQAAVRGPVLTTITISIWSIILVATAIAVHCWLYDYRIAYYIGTAIGLLGTLRAGKIE